MPLRTDLVSGAECDRVAWPHHAAAEAIGQGKERGTRRPGTHRKAAWTTALRWTFSVVSVGLSRTTIGNRSLPQLSPPPLTFLQSCPARSARGKA